jgi:hypothetical protein
VAIAEPVGCGPGTAKIEKATLSPEKSGGTKAAAIEASTGDEKKRGICQFY